MLAPTPMASTKACELEFGVQSVNQDSKHAVHKKHLPTWTAPHNKYIYKGSELFTYLTLGNLKCYVFVLFV